MDFTIYNIGGIDYSPAPWISRTTLVLEEPELRNAELRQFERFWRVWHLKRNEYINNFIELTLVLRPGYTNNSMDLTGINRFLEYYRTNVEPYCTTKGLHVYLDCYTAVIDHVQYSVLDAPQLLFSIAPTPTYVPGAWPRLPDSFLRETLTTK